MVTVFKKQKGKQLGSFPVKKILDGSHYRIFFTNPKTYNIDDEETDSFYIGNIAKVKYSAKSKYVGVFVHAKPSTKAIKPSLHGSQSTLMSYWIRFYTTENAQKFVVYLIKGMTSHNPSVSKSFISFLSVEIDNVATGLDLATGQLGMIHSKQKTCHSHLGCIRRKLVDLYTICKLPDSLVLQFARQAFINVSHPSMEDERCCCYSNACFCS